MAADPNDCRDHNEAAVIPGLHRSLQKLPQMFEQWELFEVHSDSQDGWSHWCLLFNASILIHLAGLVAGTAHRHLAPSRQSIELERECGGPCEPLQRRTRRYRAQGLRI